MEMRFRYVATMQTEYVVEPVDLLDGLAGLGMQRNQNKPLDRCRRKEGRLVHKLTNSRGANEAFLSFFSCRQRAASPERRVGFCVNGPMFLLWNWTANGGLTKDFFCSY
ncbi:hypothetical protein EYF80_051984 [Liparis tanakae]|uniref:Uncharacterized protein n=1 Tax=Liparis tanakae TaxID=230148 RepID=A0A4Z2F9K0_9TELE|nr:hypothetical protein EYF80_051984 [Liparis tanakae]